MKLLAFVDDPATDYMIAEILLLLIKANCVESAFPILSTIYLVVAAIITIIMVVYAIHAKKSPKIRVSFLFKSLYIGLIPLFVLQETFIISAIGQLVLSIIAEVLCLLFAVTGILPIFARNEKE